MVTVLLLTDFTSYTCAFLSTVLIPPSLPRLYLGTKRNRRITPLKEFIVRACSVSAHMTTMLVSPGYDKHGGGSRGICQHSDGQSFCNCTCTTTG